MLQNFRSKKIEVYSSFHWFGNMKHMKGKIRKVTHVRDPLIINIVIPNAQMEMKEKEKEKREKKYYGATAPYLPKHTKYVEYYEVC